MKSKFTWLLTLCAAFVMQFSFAQEKTITGTVSDDSGLPLPGATVIVSGTSNGTTTDFDGNYSIQASEGQSLEFSYVGYSTQTVRVGSGNTINAQLDPDNQLEEVVVVAYGSQKRENLTSAVSVVEAESIENIPIASVDQVLQGQVAGLNVNVGSGQPGQSGTILIRGRGSFNVNADIEPLFVIDGIPVDQDNFRALNPNDIASISVLKDGSAAALYGNRGANGVVVITTKKGNYETPLSVTYRSQYGISGQPSPNFDVLNSRQLLDYQAQVGSGLGATLTPEERAARGAAVSTNWEDVFFRQGVTQQHEVVLQAGGENARTFNSIQYFDQEGITQRTGLRRFSLRNNSEVKNDKFTFGSTLQLAFTRSDFTIDAIRGNNTGGQLDNPFLGPYLALPFFDAFNPDGSLNFFGTEETGAFNPDGTLNPNGANGFLNTPFITLNTNRFNTDQEDEIRVIGGLNASYKLNDHITFNTSFGADYIQINNTFITSPSSIRGLLSPTEDAQIKGTRFESFTRTLQVNFNNGVTYANTFGENHNVSATAFIEYNKNHFRNFNFQGFGLDPRIENSFQAITDGNTTEVVDGEDTRPYVPNIGGTTIDRGLFSVAGLLSYNYADKYNVTASVRRDASSRFQDENEWGTFFGIAGRWNINKENFLAGADWVDDLALRLSYGELGNENLGLGQGQIFATRNLFGLGTGYLGNVAITPTSIGNPALSWETKQALNLGIDYSFFQGRLSGNFELFKENTVDILFNTPISPASSGGFTTLNTNIGELENRGFELAISYDLIRNENTTVNLFANTAFVENEIKKIDGEQEKVIGGLTTTLEVGAPFGAFFQQIWAGVNPANGEPLYFDAQGNLTNVQNTNDRVLQRDKTRDPRLNGGFGLNVSHKNWALTSLFSYQYDVWRVNSALGVIEDGGLVGFANQSTNVLRSWQQPGDITDMPRAGISQRSGAVSRYLRDASFLRLRNVQLGYTFDEDQLGSAFKSIRVYLLAQNLFTATKWEGFDPESNLSSSFFEFPVPRIYTVGFDINF